MDSTQTMKQISKDLQAIINSLKQLTESVGNIVAAFDNIIGEQLPKPKARRSPVRKKVVVKNGVVETIKRVPSTKIIYDLLKKSDRGMEITDLMKATGYDQRKVYNVTFRLKKEGKIESVERGVYRAI